MPSLPTRFALAALLVAALACTLPAAWAQKSNEIFIPIGQSPGLSRTVTLIARVLSADPAAATLTVAGTEGSAVTVSTTAKTHIWLDRSLTQQRNRVGTLADCRRDLRVEIKFRDNDARAAVAEWIKVQVPD